MKRELTQAVKKAVTAAFGKQAIPEFTFDTPPAGQAGDIALNISFALAKKIRKSPNDIAKALADKLSKLDAVKRVHSSGGFLNIEFDDDFLTGQTQEILTAKGHYGSSAENKGRKARVEYISANPTGPLHIGNARGGPLGDVIANVLEAVGYNVLREYLHNDIGGQVNKFGEALLGTSEEYKGEYVRELVKKIGKMSNPDEAGRKAVELMFKEVLDDAKAMGIAFDSVYHESELAASGKTKAALQKIKSALKRKDGATWFAPSDDFLKDRETVVVKSDGSYTYFANDIAYHNEKFADRPDLVIDVLGSNHHGHVPRLQAVVKALGYDVEKLKFVLYQLVRVKRGKQVVKMSKRAGDFVTAREVLDEVGKDAFRFLMLMHDPNTHIDFDLELAKKKSQENPVYYVQYACVRARSIIQKANVKSQNFNSKVNIGEPTERKLVLQLLKLPDLVEELAQTLRVHQLATYAVETARLFHDFYEKLPVIKNEKVNQSRLALVQETLVVLENTLQLLGVGIPEKM